MSRMTTEVACDCGTCIAISAEKARRSLGVPVHTPGKLSRVPNQPKTAIRGIRVPDELWNAAKDIAASRGEDVSTVVRAALERYVKRKDKGE